LLPPASSGAAWFSGIAALNPEDSTAAQQQYGGKSSKGKNGSTKSDENGLGYAGGRYGDTSEDDDDDDDPFMERVGGDQNSSNCSSAPSNINSKQELNNASPTTALSDNAKLGPSTHFGWVPIAMQAHEAEIDDCLRCAVGGYQHFRLAFTDAQRGLAGATMVERTGGEFLKLNSDCLQFSTTKSIGGVSRAPYTEGYVSVLLVKRMGSVLRRDCIFVVVCTMFASYFMISFYFLSFCSTAGCRSSLDRAILPSSCKTSQNEQSHLYILTSSR